MNETPEPLRLVAFDSDDLDVISANLQDSLVQVADMAYLPRSRRFALLAARFDWVGAAAGSIERCRTGLHFERVLKVSCSGFSPRDHSLVLNLLRIGFRETAAPGGEVELIFSGGCGLRLQVECLEARICDRDERWKARSVPDHPCDDESAGPPS
jgi:hypothetical protein